jgi:Na+/H+-dicarboxylate symporter
MERIGAGFIAMLASILYAMFDLVASLLVLLGFLIFRWAVIAAPILGTVGLLRPASGGFRRLMNAVVAACSTSSSSAPAPRSTCSPLI